MEVEQHDKIIGDNACDLSRPGSGSSPADDDDDDEKRKKYIFYQRLTKLHHSSGLSFLFNFQETNLNLHLLYGEVIQRGGFTRVTEAGKWDEVALALKLKSNASMLPAQLQKVYEVLLLQYEQVYSKRPDESYNSPYNSPAKNPPGSTNIDVKPGSSTGKRKQLDGFVSMVGSTDINAKPGNSTGKRKQLDGNPNGHEKKRKSTGSKRVNKNSTMTNPHSTELSKSPDAPMKPRNGYQIFIMLECNRLKMIHGETLGCKNTRDMATTTWKAFSDEEKKPYLDASKMDRKRYDKELAQYMSDNVKSQCLINNTSPSSVSFSPSSEGAVDEYRVSLGAEVESENIQVPDESMVKLAVEAMKNAKSSDPMFQTDFSSDFLDMTN